MSTNGNDIITTTSGDDSINAKKGDDTIIYNVETNAGSTDTVNGGQGTDTLSITMSLSTWENSATWMRNAFVALQNYLNTGNFNHAFDFSVYAPVGSNLFNLSITKVELVKIKIGDGQEVTLSNFLANLAPDAVNDNKLITEDDVSSSGNVISNDTDDGSPANLKVVAVNGLAANVGATIHGLHGDLVLQANGSYTYTSTDPALNSMSVGETVTDTFTYKIFDSINGTDTANLTITIEGRNDAPVAVNDSVSDAVKANQSADINVVANDTDPDHNHVISVDAATLPQFSLLGATLSLNGDGTIHYDPSTSEVIQNLSGTQTIADSFQYYAKDEHGLNSLVAATVNITLAAAQIDYQNSIAHFTFVFNPDSSLTVTDQIAGPGNEGSTTYMHIPNFTFDASAVYTSTLQAPESGAGSVAFTSNDNEILVGLPRDVEPDFIESILRARNDHVALIGTDGRDLLINSTQGAIIAGMDVQMVGGRGDDLIRVNNNDAGTETILYAHGLQDFELGQDLSLPSNGNIVLVAEYVGSDLSYDEGRDEITSVIAAFPNSTLSFDGQTVLVDDLVLQAPPGGTVVGTDTTKEINGLAGNATLDAGNSTHALLIGGPGDILYGNSTSIAGFFANIAYFNFEFMPDSLVVTDQVPGHVDYAGVNTLYNINNFNFQGERYTSIVQAPESGAGSVAFTSNDNEILVALPRDVEPDAFESILRARNDHVALIGTDGRDLLINSTQGAIIAGMDVQMVGGRGDDLIRVNNNDAGTETILYAHGLQDFELGQDLSLPSNGNIVLVAEYVGSDLSYDEGRDEIISTPATFPNSTLSFDGQPFLVNDLVLQASPGDTVTGSDITKEINGLAGNVTLDAGTSTHALLIGGPNDILYGNSTSIAGFFASIAYFKFEFMPDSLIVTDQFPGHLDYAGTNTLYNISNFNFQGERYTSIVQAPESGTQGGTILGVALTTNDNEILVGLPRDDVLSVQDFESALRAANDHVALIGTDGADILVNSAPTPSFPVGVDVQMVGGGGRDLIIVNTDDFGTETILYAHPLEDFELRHILEPGFYNISDIEVKYLGNDLINESTDLINNTASVPALLDSSFNFAGLSYQVDDLIIQADPDSTVSASQSTKEIIGLAGNVIMDAGTSTHALLIGGPGDVMYGNATAIAGFLNSIANFHFESTLDSWILTDQILDSPTYAGTNTLYNINNFDFQGDRFTSIVQAPATGTQGLISLGSALTSNDNEILVGLPRDVARPLQDFESALRAANDHVALIGTDGSDRLVNAATSNSPLAGIDVKIVGGGGFDLIQVNNLDFGTETILYAHPLADFELSHILNADLFNISDIVVRYIGNDPINEGFDVITNEGIGLLDSAFKFASQTYSVDDLILQVITNSVVGTEATKEMLSIFGNAVLDAGSSIHAILVGASGDVLLGNSTATAGYLHDIENFSFSFNTADSSLTVTNQIDPSVGTQVLHDIDKFIFQEIRYNFVHGGDGSDNITAGAGNQILSGGGSDDNFIFNARGVGDVDTLIDFTSSADKLVFASDFLTQESRDNIAANGLIVDTATEPPTNSTNATFIMDTTNHNLYYDTKSDEGIIKIIHLSNDATVTAADIVTT